MAEGVPSLPSISLRSRLPAHLQARSGPPFAELTADGGEVRGDDREVEQEATADAGARDRERGDSVKISAEARRLFAERRRGAEPGAEPPPPAARPGDAGASSPGIGAGVDVTV